MHWFGGFFRKRRTEAIPTQLVGNIKVTVTTIQSGTETENVFATTTGPKTETESLSIIGRTL
jgi:hypothetical protein